MFHKDIWECTIYEGFMVLYILTVNYLITDFCYTVRNFTEFYDLFELGIVLDYQFFLDDCLTPKFWTIGIFSKKNPEIQFTITQGQAKLIPRIVDIENSYAEMRGFIHFQYLFHFYFEQYPASVFPSLLF